jgi:hypothetical protein
MQKMVKTTGQSSGYMVLLDEAGEEIKRLAFGAKHGYSDSAEAEREMEEMVKPVILDMPKYLKSVSSEMSGVLEDIVEDGVVTPLTEKPLLEGYLETLKDLEKEYKVEFAASGLDKLLSQIEDTLAGKKIEIEVQAKTIWEDWSSAAYREKFLADNPQLSALINPSQGDEWSDAIGRMAEDAENGDQVAKAALQDWQIAVQGFADGTISSMGYASEALYDLIMLYQSWGSLGLGSGRSWTTTRTR